MYSNKRKHTFLEKNYRYALIFSLVTWDPNYYNSLQRPSKLMARFFQRFLIFKSFHVCIYLLLPDAFFSREMAAVVASSFNVI